MIVKWATMGAPRFPSFMYMSPMAQRVLGSYSHPFMLAVGIVEMAVGVMVITRWTRLGAYIASLWLALIAINLLMTGQFFDIALRDVGLCLSAFGLAKLTEAIQVKAKPETTEPITVHMRKGMSEKATSSSKAKGLPR